MLSAKIAKVYKSRNALWSMAVSQLRARYSGSLLGISWALINPLLTTLAVSFIFTQVMKTDIRAFSLFVLSALLPWFFFSTAVSEATTSMKQNIGLLRQFTIPKEAIPISTTLANFLNFLFGFIVIVPVFIICNIAVLKYFWLVPFIIFLYFVFTLGICLIFSVLYVYFQDLSQLLNIALMFLFWVTPIFYSIESIPEKWQWVILLNPSSSYVSVFRLLLYDGSWGNAWLWFLCSLFAALSLVIGYSVFVWREKDILKHI